MKVRYGVKTVWHSARHPTYEYEFTLGYEPRGASHSWELQYVFGNLGEQASAPEDRRVSDQVQQYWANFARTGNPNGSGLSEWPKADDAKRAYMEFTGDGPLVKSALRGAFCQLFSEKIAEDIAKALKK